MSRLVLRSKHRVLCGDSTKPEDVARVMGGEKACLMNTDPPYGVALDPRVKSNLAEMMDGRHRPSQDVEREIEGDDLTGEVLQAFLEAAIRSAVPHLIDNCAFYLWHPMLTQGTFFAAAAAADILIHRQIIWVKPALLFGFGDYHWRHELCFYGWRRGHRPEFYGPRNQDTVWELTHDTSNIHRVHPTQKPVELFVRPILNHTREGELIYEPFAGSGSQYMAAQQLNRRCAGIELAPGYVDVICRRYETAFGEPAVLESTGQTFKELSDGQA